MSISSYLSNSLFVQIDVPLLLSNMVSVTSLLIHVAGERRLNYVKEFCSLIFSYH